MSENPNSPRGSVPPKTPVWVKVFFILIVLIILIVVAVHLMGVRFDHGGGASLFGVLMSNVNALQIL